jgi:hypothetical protein
MGELYGHGQMRGPFDYGCLLTLSSRREGYASPGMYFLSILLLAFILFLNPGLLDNSSFGISNPVTPKKNMRAFGGSGSTASSEWYDAKLQNCIDYDKPSTCLRYRLATILNNILFYFIFQFLSMMLRRKASTLSETTSSECRTFLCTKGREKLVTCLSTPLFRFFLLCLPTAREHQGLLRCQQSALPSTTYYLSTSILLFIMELSLAMFRFGCSCFLFFRPCVPIIPTCLPILCKSIITFITVVSLTVF